MKWLIFKIILWLTLFGPKDLIVPDPFIFLFGLFVENNSIVPDPLILASTILDNKFFALIVPDPFTLSSDSSLLPINSIVPDPLILVMASLEFRLTSIFPDPFNLISIFLLSLNRFLIKRFLARKNGRAQSKQKH